MVDLNPQSSIPNVLQVDDVIDLDFSDYQTDYPSTDYTLALNFSLDSTNQFSINVDDQYSARLDLSGKEAGDWRYELRVTATNGGASRAIDNGLLRVKPSLLNGDTRTHAQKTLAAIEAVIENRATKDQQSYTIAGRSLERMSVADLLEFRNQYRREVNSELAQLGGYSKRRKTVASFK